MEVESNNKISNLDIETKSASNKLYDAMKKKGNQSCFLGQRHGIALIGFIISFFVTAIRLVLSVSLVAMVKHKQTNEDLHFNESQLSCPLPPGPQKRHIDLSMHGEFDWSTELQGYLLAIGFVSFLITQTPGGRLSDVIGAKSILVVSNVLSGLCTIISPFVARWHVYGLMGVHFLRGASQGFTQPATFKLISNWIPKNERGTLSTLVFSGFAAGIALGGLVSGWLCDIPGFGWPSAFYILGFINVLLGIAVYFLCYEHPLNHPWITDEELKYITNGLENKTSGKQLPTPWCKIFSSVTSYAYFYGLFGHYWSITYYATVHPTFMGTVLHFSMTENGLTSCLPVLMKTVGGVTASIICYWITKRNLIGIPKLRKLTTGLGSFGFSLCMAGILLAGCDVTINILCFALSLFSTGIALSGVMISGVDMAPVYAGSLMGVASSIAGLSCISVPVITGLVTTHEMLSEWRIVFWINLVVVGSSGLVYVLFGSAEAQSWNYPEDENLADTTPNKIIHSHENQAMQMKENPSQTISDYSSNF